MKFLVFAVLYLVYPFSFLFPRKEKTWAFGSFRGAFNDNAKYLFFYCSEHCRGIRCVWLSKNKNTVSEVRRLGLEAYHIASLKGIWYALTSKYWFFNSYTSDIMYAFSGGAVCINLWHGVGLKRTEFNITSGELAKRYQQKQFWEVYYHPESFKRPDWFVSSTPFQTVMFASSFRIPQDRCLELGYPRNAILTCSQQQREAFVEKYVDMATRRLMKKIVDGGYSKVYLYMPTWRDSQRNVFVQSFDLPKLDSLMRERNELMLLKPHANVVVDEKEFGKMTNICLVDSKADIYLVMPYTDVLITDYSSVLYDYILMPDKGVVLYLYDYAEYIKDRDLYYPYDENVVGRKVYTFDELYQCLAKGDCSFKAEERQAILDRFWGKTVNVNASESLSQMVLSGKLSARL